MMRSIQPFQPSPPQPSSLPPAGLNSRHFKIITRRLFKDAVSTLLISNFNEHEQVYIIQIHSSQKQVSLSLEHKSSHK